ncbi:MAG: TolC family protein [Acidobacteriota bacterium]
MRRSSLERLLHGGRPLTVAPLLGAALLAVLPVRGEEVLTLERALALAAERSLPAETAALDLEAARGRTDEVRSAYWPVARLEGGRVNLDNDPAFRFGPVTFPAGDQVYWKYDLRLQYVLYDGGRRGTALKAGRLAEEAVTRSGAAAVRRLQAEVAARYVSVLALRRRQEVVELRRKALLDHLRTVKDLFEQGFVARNDLLRTEVALRAVEDQASSLQAAERSALEELVRSLGLPPETPVTLPASLDPPPSLPWDEETLAARAEAQNESVKALQARLEALNQSAVLARKEYAPVLLAEAGHGYEQNRYMAHPHVNRLFVGLSWDLFDGGKRAARVASATAEARKAERELLEARRQARTAALAAYRDFQEALRQTATARLDVEASLENLRIVEDQYREGLSRSTDVLDAEALLAESRFREVQTHYDAYARQAAVLAAAGEDLVRFYATPSPNKES